MAGHVVYGWPPKLKSNIDSLVSGISNLNKEVLNHSVKIYHSHTRLAMIIYIFALAIFMPSSSLAKNLVGYSYQNQKIAGGEDAEQGQFPYQVW